MKSIWRGCYPNRSSSMLISGSAPPRTNSIVQCSSRFAANTAAGVFDSWRFIYSQLVWPTKIFCIQVANSNNNIMLSHISLSLSLSLSSPSLPSPPLSLSSPSLPSPPLLLVGSTRMPPSSTSSMRWRCPMIWTQTLSNSLMTMEQLLLPLALPLSIAITTSSSRLIFPAMKRKSTLAIIDSEYEKLGMGIGLVFLVQYIQ